jgi:hypothetical protein
VTVEQPAQAAQNAAAAGLAARIAAARLTTTAGLSGATTARLGGAAGLSGTTTAGFTTTSRFAAARIAAAIVLAEQVEQAAAVTATRLTTRITTTVAVTAKEGRRIASARKHRGDAQDQRRKNKSNVHRETPTRNRNGRGTLRVTWSVTRTRRAWAAARGKCRSARSTSDRRMNPDHRRLNRHHTLSSTQSEKLYPPADFASSRKESAPNVSVVPVVPRSNSPTGRTGRFSDQSYNVIHNSQHHQRQTLGSPSSRIAVPSPPKTRQIRHPYEVASATMPLFLGISTPGRYDREK